MAVPTILRRPLRGMGTGLGRVVLALLKASALAATLAALFVILDRMLLPDGIEEERERARPSVATNDK